MPTSATLTTVDTEIATLADLHALFGGEVHVHPTGTRCKLSFEYTNAQNERRKIVIRDVYPFDANRYRALITGC